MSSYPSQFSALNYSSLSIRYANSHYKALKTQMEQNRYSKIIVFQHVYTDTQSLVFDTQILDTKYILHPQKSVKVLSSIALRISEANFRRKNTE